MLKNNTLKRKLLSWVIPLIIITSYGFLSMQGDLRFSIPLLMGITAFIVITLSAGLYFGEKKDVSWSPALIIIIAIIVRCFYLFRPPELSDDIYRYLWDGLQILQGNNPYAFAPTEMRSLNDISPDLLEKINHPEFVTIYPPTAQLIFMAGVYISNAVIGIKVLLLCIDLVTCAVIMKILTKMEMPASRVVLYAWHPIPVFEIASSGHIDGAAIFFLLLSILFLQSAVQAPKNTSSRKEQVFIVISGLSFGASALVKLYPFFLTPALLVMVGRGRRILFAIGLVISSALLTVPFMPELYNSFDTLGMYMKNWEFSNFAFRTLRDITSSGDIPRLFLAFSFLCTVFFLTMRLWRKRVKEDHNCIALSGSGDDLQCDRKRSINMFTNFFRSLYIFNFAFLLLTPTLYPWYLLGLVCLFPFVREPAGIIFSWSVFLSYYVLIKYAYLGQWVENSTIPALIWVTPILGALVNTWLGWQYRQNRHIIVEK